MLPSRRITTSGSGKLKDESSVYFSDNLADDSLNVNCIANTWNASVGEWNTISCWFKMDTDNSTRRIWNINSARPGLLLTTRDGAWQISYNTGNSDRMGFSKTFDEMKRWNHIIMSWEVNNIGDDTALTDLETGKMKPLMWFNGVRQSIGYQTGGVTTSNACDHDNATNLEISSNSGNDANNTQPSKMWMSDLAGYKTKFDDSMAATVYNGKEPFNHKDWSIGSQYLTLWYRFGDESGDTVPTYHENMATIFTDDTSSPGSNDYGNLYDDDRKMLRFNGESTAFDNADEAGSGYDVLANSAFTGVNCTAEVVDDDSATGLEITNTTTSEGSIRAEVTVESSTKYQIFFAYYSEDQGYVTGEYRFRLGTSAGGTQYFDDNPSPSESETVREFTTGASDTTLHVEVRCNTTTSGHTIRLKRIHLQKVDFPILKDASGFGQPNTTTDGEPIFSNESPF
tara:strand:+ start:3077 stop:4441 length:1365 start_codon:yes stop_codon:yes gene_type:complete